MNSQKQEKPIIRWLDVTTQLWPIVAGIVVLVSYLSGRLEDSEAKLRRIHTQTSPIIFRLQRIEAKIEKLQEKLDTHSHLGGHNVMAARVTAIERDLAEIKRQIK